MALMQLAVFERLRHFQADHQQSEAEHRSVGRGQHLHEMDDGTNTCRHLQNLPAS